MGYRPRPSSKYIDRDSKLRKLQQERADYVFLRNEMSPTPGDPVDVSFREAIADVDARIAELNPLPPRISPIVPSKPLPPAELEIVRKGYLA